MTNMHRKSIATFLGAASLIGLAAPALAQPAAQADSGANTNDLNEIIVTAQKREQRLSDVPVTITASTGTQLQSSGVVDVSQIGRVAPSFTVAASVYGFQVFSIRGVNFNTQQASAPPAVSVYTDEAPLPYSAMTGGLLLDVERVEVLKGPQGTLFGQNSTAGSINVIAAKPTSTPHAGFHVDVNHFGQVQAEGYISGPLSDTLRARLAVQTTQFGAWQKGYYLNDRKNGDQNRGAARLLLDWTPTDKLTVGVNINGNYDKGEVIQPQLGKIDPVVLGTNPILDNYPVGNKNRNTDIDPGLNTHGDKYMVQGTVRIDYEASDAAKLTSLTSFAHFNQKNSPINYDAIALPNAAAFVHAKIDSISQEVRLSGILADDRLTYVLGGNYTHDVIREGQETVFEGYSAFPLGTRYNINYRVTAESKAAFGNIDYKFTDALTFSAGARYTWTKQTIDGCVRGNDQWTGTMAFISGIFRGAEGLAPNPSAFITGGCVTMNDTTATVPNPTPGGPLLYDYLPMNTVGTQKQNNFSWRGSLSYKVTPDNMLYVTISRGYKAGVFPVQPNILNSEADPVKQEKLTSYEVGAKLAFFDRRMRLNASGFYYDYRDKQFYTYFPFVVPELGTSSQIINIPKSRVYGFDADVQLNPSHNLTLKGAVTYINTRVLKLDRVVYSGDTGQPQTVVGKQFNYAPPWSATFDAEYRIPVNDSVEGMLGAGGQWYDKSFSDLGEAEGLANPAYVTIDLRAGVQSPTGKWRASVWVRNLTDKDYWTSIYRSGDMLSRYAGLPRTFGASFGVNF